MEKTSVASHHPRYKSLRQILDDAIVAYLSAPAEFYTEANIARVRQTFATLAIKSFDKFFRSRKQWSRHLPRYLAKIDILVLLVPSSREIRGGVLRDLRAALKLKKPVVVIDLAGNYWLYCGCDPLEENGVRVRPRRRVQERRVS